MPGTFNVKDFGAKGDGVTDDRVAIQAAVDAAFASGGGTVYMPVGEYRVSAANPLSASAGSIMLKSNVSLTGDGMGATVIKLVDGSSTQISGIVRTPASGFVQNVGVSNLTIDGNRSNVTGAAEGFLCGVKPHNGPATENVTIESVEVRNMNGYGFDPHEITNNFVIRNSISYNNAKDGFVADYETNSLYENNIAFDNDRNGFNITTSTNTTTFRNNYAYDNGSAGLVVQRGFAADNPDNFPPPHHVTIEGGAFFDNAREGVIMRIADHITVTGVDVFQNGRQGVRFFGTTDSDLLNSVVRNNSREKINGYDDVNLSQYDDTDFSGAVIGSQRNNVTSNVIYSDLTTGSRSRIYEALDLSDFNNFTGNFLRNSTGGSNPVVKNGVNSTYTNYVSGAVGGADTVLAGTLGSDSIIGGILNEIAIGDMGDDTINGGGGNDKLYGDEGDDSIIGGEGNDTLAGDPGNDFLNGGNGTDNIYGDSGNDTIIGGDANDTIFGGDGADSISGDAGNDSLIGNDGNDTILGGTGNDTIYSGADNDSVSGGDGNDFIYSFAGNNILQGNAGNDTIIAVAGADSLVGGTGNDFMVSGDGNDTIIADSGNDTVIAGRGDDSVEHGVGTGLFYLGAGSDTVASAFQNLSSADTIQGEGGNDTLRVLFSNVQVNLNLGTWNNLRGFENLVITNNTSNIVVTNTYFDHPGFDGSVFSVNAATSQYNFTLNGATVTNGSDAVAVTSGSGNDTIVGTSGGDTINGGAGNDSITGGAGNDSILGGSGNDTVTVTSQQFNALDTIQGGSGLDTFTYATGTVVVNLNTDTLTNLRGFETINIMGNTSNITVGASYFDHADFDGSVLNVTSFAPYNLTFNASSVINGTDAVSVAGGTGNDNIVGTSGGDTINGGAGNDNITGGNGFDSLTGGTGADKFIFNNISESTLTNPDTITDFTQADLDKIDLNLIDADSVTAGNQTFTFIGNAAFSGAVGELKFATSGGFTFITGVVTSGSGGDFQIKLNGTITLNEADFVL